jgi:predicted O-linked N-acetylglucosamine transferase (SPINDLY family)
MNNKILELQELFKNREFSKLIFTIENSINDLDKTPSILNILGVARILRGPKNKETIESAIPNFKESYLKSSQSISCLDSLINLINSTSDLFDQKNSSDDFFNQFNELINFYNNFEEQFGHNEKLVLAIVRVYKRLNNIDKVLYYYDQLKKNKTLSLLSISSLIYNNSFTDKWSQEDFFSHSKLLEKYTPTYPEEKLSNINFENKDKIKIGFLTTDLRGQHSITYFLKSILNDYDKDKFEIVLFLNHFEDDEDTKLFIKLVDGNINISRTADIAAINIIRDMKIDIMFDLMGITSKPRIALFKNRLAPIQISWLGYCNTSGINNMDYIISDPNLVFPEETNLYTEKLIYLENIWNCHSGFNIKRQKNPLPSDQNNFVTFGSFNNFQKINDNVAKVWSKILKNIKNSKLILKSSLKKDYTRLKEFFKKDGVLDSVIFYEKKSSNLEHLNLYKDIDIALDTFPYNGVTTSFEAIWMGVPVLTMKGYNFNSRCGESINKNLNLNHLIAEDNKDYISKAIELATNKEKLIETRDFIFANAVNSPLFDQVNFSKNFYNSLENVFNKT